MDAAQKTAAMIDWMRTFDRFVKLNAIESTRGQKAMNTITSDAENFEYISGIKNKTYYFALVSTQHYSSGNDPTNQEALDDMAAWGVWVTEQWNAGNHPDWGEEVSFIEIKMQQSVPELALIFDDTRTAKYQMIAKIDYRE